MLAFFHLVPPSQDCKMRYKSKSESSVSSRGAGVSKGEDTDQTRLLEKAHRLSTGKLMALCMGYSCSSTVGVTG